MNSPLPGQQVVHVAQDLDTDLEALFNSVMNPKPSSWRKKLLPESFFREPELASPGSHSRQSSTDSSVGVTPRSVPGHHARSHSSPASFQLGAPVSASPGTAQRSHLRQQSYDVSEDLPLPPGWEMAFTSTGQRYFLNHVEKITTWQDPRKTISPVLHQVNHHAVAPNVGTTQQRSMALSQPNLMMSQHHQHQHQQHRHQLQQPQAQVPPLVTNPPMSQQQSLPGGLLSLPNPMANQQQHQQKMRLQRIQMEQEHIRMRQEELRRQEVALCRQMPMESDNMAPNNTMPMSQVPMHNNSSDPFLSGHFHSREQSSDSGLGLGSCSVPTTPEGFLNHMDDMDTGEVVAQVGIGAPQQSRFPDFLDSLPGTNVDLGTLDGADLIPILNDVESVLNKSEPFLTWL